MSFYFGIYWGVFIVFLLIYCFAWLTKNKKIKKFLQDYSYVFIITAFSFLVMAFITNDPFFEVLGFPKEYEWLAGLLSGGFALWQFYLNPLKERVIKTETEVSSIKTDVSAIRGDVGIIKDKMMNGNPKK